MCLPRAFFRSWKIKPFLFIAFRYLLGRGNKGNRYLLGAAAGIALSLIPIMVTLIVADGMIRGITDRFLELGTGHLQVFPRPPVLDAPTSLDTAAALIVPGTDDITGVWRELDGVGVILSTAGKTGASIRAVDPSFWQDEGSRRYLSVKDGEGVIEADNEALLGEDLAREVGAKVGGPLRLMTLRVGEDGRTIPRTTLFTVKGIVSSGYHELDAMWCIISYDTGKRILSDEISQSFLMVKIKEPYSEVDRAVFDIAWKLGGTFAVYTWRELQRAQYSSYESTRQMLIFIMALVVLVAAVNVSSAVSMLIIERQRDIAVLKSAGTGAPEINRIFLFCSLLTGIAGAVPGISAGLLIGCAINSIVRGIEAALSFVSALLNGEAVKILDPGFYLQEIPVIVDWQTVILIVFLTVLCSVLSSTFCARRAGKSRPIDLLRKF
ncbi:MAG: ABC transporter permease [Spirochaetaceae bacterium]|jgi:lipoprotein-releasing system permease protein|nr:ABC transporter permease [Spirochaetaceae bacterium]